MLILLFVLAVCTLAFGIIFKVTELILAIAVWVIIKLPIALFLWGIGIICCCTLILIPVGLSCFRAGLGLMVPGHIL